MEISTEISKLKNTRKHIIRGAINLDELKTYLGEIYSSSDIDASMHVLWDLRDVDFSSLSIDTVESVMDFISQHWGDEGTSRAAMVVTYDLDYSMSKTYQMMLARAMSAAVEVFKDMDSAERWIGSEQ